MIESIGIFVAKKVASFAIGKGLNKLFTNRNTFERRLAKVIDKSIDEYHSTFPIAEADGKFPFYKSQLFVEELLKLRFFGDTTYKVDESNIISQINRNNNIITPTKEQLSDFLEIFEKHRKADEELKNLEIEENYKVQIFINTEKLDQISELLKRYGDVSVSLLKRISTDLENVPPNILSHPSFPTALVDQKIEEEVSIIRKSRFFAEFNRVQTTMTLARMIMNGEFSVGTDAVKSRALAWCARFLATTKELSKAKEYLKSAKDLATSPEIEIADAFINSKTVDKNSALGLLAKIDSPLARSAALMVVTNYENQEEIDKWLKATGIQITDLDSDGKYFLLMHYLYTAQWKKAKESLKYISDEDSSTTPILYHIVAITHLLSAVPEELCEHVVREVPFEAERFPLASDSQAINSRRTAHGYFMKAREIAKQLNCFHAANIYDEYALWLELKDPDDYEKGKQRLMEKLRDLKSSLRVVHFGFQFGIKMDLQAIEREIERQIALNGGITQDTAFARFSLAFTQESPEGVSNYIDHHHEELVKYIDEKSLLVLQIEMLSKAGLPDRASRHLENLLKKGISDVEERRLQRIIAEAEGTDPLEARKTQFEQTNSLGDLVSLVEELERKKEWFSLCQYGQILFERTLSVQNAERLVNALSNTHDSERIVEFLNNNTDLLSQSRNLQMFYCWSLYNEGRLTEARDGLKKLSDNPDNPNYRALLVNIGIAIGDMSSLSSYVDNEYQKKEKRSARELLNSAHLAVNLGSSIAKELIFAAVDKGREDASILANAYFLASYAGFEDDPNVFNWVQKAAELSGQDGPIKKMTIKDVLDMKPEWESRESESWNLLSRGEVPIFLAAQALNKSLVDMMLYPAFANLSLSDPRHRGIVPAYSGKRQPQSFNISGTVGLEATSLITLSYLNLLEKALDAFDTVYIPHSTLAWIFEEKENAAFHQPSRIKKAHHLSHLLATESLEKFNPTTIPDSNLSAQVGDELAQLIAEAEHVRDEDIQRIVVRPAPVHRLASLMEEEADLTQHANILSGCQSIIDKLRQKGHITADEEKKARAYLQIHEKPWPNQPEITDGAILYLDDLAIHYFQHLGILEKLRMAGFRAITSAREISEIKQLISYERISGNINDTLENIRSALNERIESGKIKINRIHNFTEPRDRSISGHPTAAVIDLARCCDLIISDDRFLNQHANIDAGKTQAPIFTTFELIDAMHSSDLISSEDRLEYRTKLRRAGYFLIPVSEEELDHCLYSSSVNNKGVEETAELKAIRENILHARMSTWLQFPIEIPWLDTLLIVFIRVLKNIWKPDYDFETVRVRSNWLVDQIDVRGWAHRLGEEVGDNIVKTGRGVHILMLLSPPVDIPIEVKVQYWNWVENRILYPIKEQDPELYSWLIDWYKKQIAAMSDTDISKGN